MITGHGGNFRELARSLGCPEHEITDMSSNLNPLGPPEGLADHLRDRLEAMLSLPQVDSGNITQLFADHAGVPRECVLAANGTTQFIYSAPQALGMKKALIVGPAYSDYADGCAMHGIETAYFLTDAETGFKPNMEKLKQRIPGHDTVFICNPSNPTGVLIPAKTVRDLCRTFPKVRFIIDESYLPFVRTELNRTMLEMLEPNMIVLNSMSKVFRIPGLRIGFLVAREDIVKRFEQYALPWSVNSLAQEAVKYIYENMDTIDGFLARTRCFVNEELYLFVEQLKGVPGLKLYPADTYFVLAQLTGDLTSDKLWGLLAEEKLLIRDCSNFTGLSHKFVRFSLKERDTNMKLVQLLKKHLC